MQDNLINPQAVDQVVHSLFGSYEKFVLSLIERRKELEAEKQKLTDKLDRIKKEETLIKKTLTGYNGTKIGNQYYNARSNSLVDKKPLTFTRNPKPQRSASLKQCMTENVETCRQKNLFSDRLSYVNEEQALVDNLLRAFHGKRIDTQFYDSQQNTLGSIKPDNIPGFGSKASPMDAIGELLSFKQGDYNQLAGKELISDKLLYSKPEVNSQISLQEHPLKAYQNEILEILHSDYLPDMTKEKIQTDVINQDIFSEKTTEGFKTNLSPMSIVTSIAKETQLTKVPKSKGIRL